MESLGRFVLAGAIGGSLLVVLPLQGPGKAKAGTGQPKAQSSQPRLAAQGHPEIVAVSFVPQGAGRVARLKIRAFNPSCGAKYALTAPVSLRIADSSQTIRTAQATIRIPTLSRTQSFDATFELLPALTAQSQPSAGPASQGPTAKLNAVILTATTTIEGSADTHSESILHWPANEIYGHEPANVHGVFEQTLDNTSAPGRSVTAQPARTAEPVEEDHELRRKPLVSVKPTIQVADSSFPPLAATVLRGSFLADPSLGGLDANIAAGQNAVLVSVSRHFLFYDKSGQPLRTKDGSREIGRIKMTDFFQPLADDLSANLQLSQAFRNKGLDDCDYYDSRCMYDPYRKRFWIVSLVTNKFSVDATKDAADQAARRNKIACAISKTSDPRDGFWMYWWDATPYDGQPGTDWIPGDRGDYPCIGISPKFMMQSDHVNNKPLNGADQYARWSMVTLVDADALAAGKPRNGWMFPRLKYGTTQIDGTWMPAMQYDAFPSNRAYLSGTVGNRLLVYGFDAFFDTPRAPKMASMALREIAWPPHADQKSSSDVPYAPQVKLGNVSPVPLRTVARGDRIWTTFHEGVVWSGQTNSQCAVRYVRASLASFATGAIPTTAASGYVERTFGKRNQADPAGDIFGYGMPAVEVDQDGNALIAYLRSGSTIFQEARFTLHFANEADVRPSAVLRPGEGTYPKNGDKPVAQSDCIGVALDPDGKTIWMAAPYAFRDGSTTKATQRIAVGKVRF